MKILLALLVLFVLSGCATFTGKPVEDRVAMAERVFRAEMAARGDDPSALVINDTGEVADLGEGPGPVLEVYSREWPHACLVAVHPTEEKFGVLVCFERTPETGL